jgi:hypothetical protein
MATRVLDPFTDSNWRELSLHSGSVGAAWTIHTAMASSNGRMYIYGNRVHTGSTAAGGSSYYSLYTASGVPDSADYVVECDLYLISSVPSLNIGPCIRASTSADTYYSAFYQSGELLLIKRVAGVNTTLGSWTSALSYGGTAYRLKLAATGTTIAVAVNGVERISVTDGAITAAGRAGLRAASVENPDEGIQIDNLWAYDAVATATPRSQVVGIIGL